MTPLRQHMIEAMQLRDLAERTQESYLAVVQQLALHYGKSPDLITEEELRQYFLFLCNEKRLAPNTTNLALNAIKFFSTYTLHRPWPLRDLVRPPLPQKLPVVLSAEEIWRIIEQVRRPDYSVCLSVIAGCGLRLLEGVRLQVTQIDSARMQRLIRSGKGNKDRAVPLPSRILSLLRAELRESAIYAEIEPEVWEQEWVADCRSVGSGHTALKYLAPYIFRVALSNNRIVRVEDDQVTFWYRQGESGERRECRLEVLAFVHRYLQHVLPKGFVKVRYYGLFRVGARRALARLRGRLWLQTGLARLEALEEAEEPRVVRELRCPKCGAVLRLERELARVRAPPRGEWQE